MRLVVRPLIVFAVLATFTAVVHSQGNGGNGGGGGGEGFNLCYFNTGSPSSPAAGQINCSLTVQPLPGYTCTSLQFSVVDPNLNTVASATQTNVSGQVTQNFTGLNSGVQYTVVINVTFQFGAQFDTNCFEAEVTTQ